MNEPRRDLTRREILTSRDAAVPPTEIRSSDLPSLKLPYEDGLIVMGGKASDGRGNLMTAAAFIPVTTERLTAVAAGLTKVASCATVVIHPRYVPSARSALALVIAVHLHRARIAAKLSGDIILCATRPTITEDHDLKVVPHAFTFVNEEIDQAEKRALWEVMRADQYEAWREHQQ